MVTRQFPFTNPQPFINQIFEDRPELAFYGSLPNAGSPFQNRLLRNNANDMLGQYWGNVGQDLMRGQFPDTTPQNFFGNRNFQQDLFNMPRQTRGVAAQGFNPRTRFLYGF